MSRGRESFRPTPDPFPARGSGTAPLAAPEGFLTPRSAQMVPDPFSACQAARQTDQCRERTPKAIVCSNPGFVVRLSGLSGLFRPSRLVPDRPDRRGDNKTDPYFPLTPHASPPYSHLDVTAAGHRTPSRAATPRVSLARQSHPFPPRKSDAPAAPYSADGR